MPKWTDKDERQYEHVRESVLEQVKSEDRKGSRRANGQQASARRRG